MVSWISLLKEEAKKSSRGTGDVGERNPPGGGGRDVFREGRDKLTLSSFQAAPPGAIASRRLKERAQIVVGGEEQA